MRRALVLCLFLVLPLLSSCTTGDEPTIALLVADTSESSPLVDVEGFEARVLATCDECRVRVYDAEDDAVQQKSQARQAEAESADVLVVVPVDPSEVESLTAGELPVLSLGTLVPGADGHVGLAQSADTLDDPASALDAARELIAGDRSSMTYVPTLDMSEKAADVAVGLLAEEPVVAGTEVEGVESWLFESQDVTLDTLTTILVGQGVVTLDELCEGATAKKCRKLGLR